MRFLVAEDDEALRSYLGQSLEADGHWVHLAPGGRAAVDAFREAMPEMAILDVNTSVREGMEIVHALRSADENLLILVLAAQDDMETRLACLDAGTDEFLGKPFAMAELRARVRALARRQGGSDKMLRCGSFTVNRMERTVSCGGETASLTPKEFALLDCLLLNRGQPVSRAVLLDKVWKMPANARTNIVDVYVNYLRRKLANLAGEPLVETVRGAGYAIYPAAAAGKAGPAPRFPNV